MHPSRDIGSVPAAQMSAPSCIIKLRGLPYKASSDDIALFFSGRQIADAGVHVIYNEVGQPSGVAFVEFANIKEAAESLKKNKQNFIRSKRYVDIFMSSVQELKSEVMASQQRVNEFSQQQNNPTEVEPTSTVLRLRGLPFSAKKNDIIDSQSSSASRRPILNNTSQHNSFPHNAPYPTPNRNFTPSYTSNIPSTSNPFNSHSNSYRSHSNTYSSHSNTCSSHSNSAQHAYPDNFSSTPNPFASQINYAPSHSTVYNSQPNSHQHTQIHIPPNNTDFMDSNPNSNRRQNSFAAPSQNFPTPASKMEITSSDMPRPEELMEHGVKGRVIWNNNRAELLKIESDICGVVTVHTRNVWSHEALETNEAVILSVSVDQHGNSHGFNVRPETALHTPMQFEGRCTAFYHQHNGGFVSLFETTRQISFSGEDVANHQHSPILVGTPVKFEMDFSNQYPCATKITILHPHAPNGHTVGVTDSTPQDEPTDDTQTQVVLPDSSVVAVVETTKPHGSKHRKVTGLLFSARCGLPAALQKRTVLYIDDKKWELQSAKDAELVSHDILPAVPGEQERFKRYFENLGDSHYGRIHCGGYELRLVARRGAVIGSYTISSTLLSTEKVLKIPPKIQMVITKTKVPITSLNATSLGTKEVWRGDV